jgi:hypothetical protein
MLSRILRYVFSKFITEIRLQIVAEVLESVEGLLQQQKSMLSQEAKNRDDSLRKDFMLEMQRVGMALAATNHQVVMTNHEINLLKLGTPTPQPENVARTPGQVDWVPHPAHFGNKIDITR